MNSESLVNRVLDNPVLEVHVAPSVTGRWTTFFKLNNKNSELYYDLPSKHESTDEALIIARAFWRELFGTLYCALDAYEKKDL